MIVLYSNHCPACGILQTKLNIKNIPYQLVDDEKVLIEKGFDFLPILEVDGTQMRLGEANKFIEAYKGE